MRAVHLNDEKSVQRFFDSEEAWGSEVKIDCPGIPVLTHARICLLCASLVPETDQMKQQHVDHHVALAAATDFTKAKRKR